MKREGCPSTGEDKIIWQMLNEIIWKIENVGKWSYLKITLCRFASHSRSKSEKLDGWNS